MDNNTLKKRPSIMEVLSKDPEEKPARKKTFTDIANENTFQPQPQKEIIKERVVVEYRDRPSGCLPNVGCGCGCRTISCSGCLFFILILIGIAYIFINKPAFIWSEVVSYLNDGYKAPAYKPQDLSSLQDSINSQISNIGEVNINLTQDQLTTLIRDKAPQLKDLTVEVDNNKLTLFWSLDNTLPSKPLYGVVDINKKEDTTLEINRTGTGRIALPDFINKTATNSIYSLFKVDGNNQNPLSLLTSLFNSQNITVKSVNLEEGVVTITADIKVNLSEQQ